MHPEDWTLEAVSNFGSVSAGRQKAPSFKEGAPRKYLRVANVYEAHIDTSDVLEMPFTDPEYSRYKLEPGDILLNEGQSIELVGRPAMYEGFPENCCFQNTLVRFKPNNRVNPHFALQLFRLCLHDGTFQKIAKKTTSIAHLGVSRFAELELLWPPLIEQTKIAQILSTWDKAINTTERMLANSQQQKQALLEPLLSGRKRFAGYPAWTRTAFSELLSESRLPGSNGEIAKKITVKLYGKGVFAKDDKRIGSESTKYYRRRAGQFIYSKLDFLNGAFGIIPEHLDSYESTLDLPAFDFSELVEPAWLLQYVSREEFYTAQLGLANGGRKARRVNPADLLGIEIPLPSRPEQQKIAQVLSTADAEIANLQAQLDKLKLEKKALMQQLLTGKRRVRLDDEEEDVTPIRRVG